MGVSGGTEELALGCLKGVAVVVDRSIIWGDEGVGSVLLGGYFEGTSDGNLEGVGPGNGDPLVFK